MFEIETPKENFTRQDDFTSKHVTTLIISLFLMIFICAGNLMAIIAVCITPALKTISNMFVVSLAIADFCTGAIIPYFTFGLYPPFWDELARNKYLCLSRMVLYLVFVSNSVLCIVTISFDRFIFIRFPLNYETMVSVRKALAVIFFNWGLAILLGSVPLYYNTWRDGFGCHSYFVVPYQYISYVLCPVFFSLCVFTAAFYLYIVTTASKHRRKVRRLSQYSSSAGLTTHWKLSSEWKSVKMFIVVFGVFFICWAPGFIAIIIHRYAHIDHFLLNFIVALGFLNSGMNFIIYSYQNKQFRHAFKKMLRGPLGFIQNTYKTYLGDPLTKLLMRSASMRRFFHVVSEQKKKIMTLKFFKYFTTNKLSPPYSSTTTKTFTNETVYAHTETEQKTTSTPASDAIPNPPPSPRRQSAPAGREHAYTSEYPPKVRRMSSPSDISN